MKSTRISSILVALLTAFAGVNCARGTAQDSSAGDLGGTSWELVRFQDSDDKTLAPDERGKYTMAFDRDGGVSARIDCNRGRGSWKSSGPSQIEFGPLALTRAMCPPAPLNDRMARDWAYVRSYVMKHDHLFLSLMADGGTYEFEPLGPAETSGAGAGESAAAEEAISGLPATFVGTIPCADCPGIRYQVNLLPENTFVSRMIYLERKTEFTDHGSWQVGEGGRTLVLRGERGAREQFALLNTNTLRMLDADGHEISSKFNYDCKRSATFAPIESQSKEGEAVVLEGTDWKLISLGGTPVQSSSKQQGPHLLLTAESHRVSGSGGCNRMEGSYELSGDNLTFSKNGRHHDGLRQRHGDGQGAPGCAGAGKNLEDRRAGAGTV
jgi:heat shock protein HslJ